MVGFGAVDISTCAVVQGGADREELAGEFFLGACGGEEAVVDPDDVLDSIDAFGEGDGGVLDVVQGEVFDFSTGRECDDDVGFVVLFSCGDIESSGGGVDGEVNNFDVGGFYAEASGEFGGEAFCFREVALERGDVAGIDCDDLSAVADKEDAFIGEGDDVDLRDIGGAGFGFSDDGCVEGRCIDERQGESESEDFHGG